MADKKPIAFSDVVPEHRRYSWEFENGVLPREVPARIFDLARRNSLLAAHLQQWRLGIGSWEQCLIGMVLSLAETNDQLLDELKKLLREKPPEPIVVHNPTLRPKTWG